MTNSDPESPLRALLEASANSPLSEADPNSLNELAQRVQISFNTKPLNLTDNMIVDNVKYFRLKRSQFATLARQKEIDDSEKPKRKRAAAPSSDLLREAIGKIEL